MSTKVVPMDGGNEDGGNEDGGNEDGGTWNFGEGQEKTQRRRSRRKTKDNELAASHHRQADYPYNELMKLDIAAEQQVSGHPHGAANGSINVSCFVLFKKLRNIDPKQSSADLSFIISLRWVAPDLAGKRLNDVSKLWAPRLAVLNADRMDMRVENPWFYPLTGDVRQIIHCEGTVANKSDLRYFPFDYETVSIKIAAEIGTGDRYVRLRWQDDTSTLGKSALLARIKSGGTVGGSKGPTPRTASSVTPPYVGQLHMEWELLPGGNKIKREPKRQHVNGNFSALEIQLTLSRKYGFYLWKIMLLVWMIAIMSWSTFLIRDGTGRLNDTEIFVMRLEFTAALLLAAVSFLYISQESIPRLDFFFNPLILFKIFFFLVGWIDFFCFLFVCLFVLFLSSFFLLLFSSSFLFLLLPLLLLSQVVLFD